MEELKPCQFCGGVVVDQNRMFSLKESGIGERFLRKTFDTFTETAENRKALAACRKYADGFDDLLPKHGGPDPGRNGLFIAGPPGTGKTHIAVAVANQLLARGTPVICMTSISMLERIKRTFGYGDVSEWEVLEKFKTVPLLIIDNIGKELQTEWSISTLYSIIDGRYERCLPIIITTNYDAESLVSRMTPRDTRDCVTAEATIDRLTEMCKGVAMTGKSWRCI